AARRLWEIADQQPSVQFHAGRDTTPDEMALEFDGVSFAYETGARSLLKDIGFRVRPGEAVAIVGPSGAGKSTLVHLAARTWDPSSGSIRLGDRDLETYSRAALARCISLVPQNPYLFSASIRENLL